MISSTLTFRTIADGLQFPEGPIALPDGAVLVVEVKSGRLLRIAPDGVKHVVAELGAGPNGAAIGPDGACYVCNNGGFNWLTASDGFIRPHGRADTYVGGSIQRVDLVTGKVDILYEACDGERLKGPNDIVFDAFGGFWFTDHGRSYDRVMDRGALFYAPPSGDVIREITFPLITPNGVGISPDGKTLYVSETETARVWSFPITGPGELAKQPWPSPSGGAFFGGAPGYRRFDSMAIEASGNVCVASLVEGGICVFSPNGDLIEIHAAPDIYCTNLCFGGPDNHTAYITLSGTGRLVAADWPRPGLKLPHQI